MSLLSKIFGGGSRSSTSSAAKTDVQTTNQSAISNAAPTVQGSGNSQTVVYQPTDLNAINAGTKLAGDAISGANQINANALDFARDALDTVQTLGEQSQAIVAAQRADNRAALADAIAYAQAASNDARDFALNVTRSESADTLQKIAQYGALAVAAVALVVILK